MENQGFDWDEYLMLTRSVAAPKAFFRQHSVPPGNEFCTGELGDSW